MHTPFNMDNMDYLEFVWLSNRINMKLNEANQQNLLNEIMKR